MSRYHANGLESPKLPRLVTPAAWLFVQTCVAEVRSRQSLSVGAAVMTAGTPDGSELCQMIFTDRTWAAYWLGLPVHRSKQPKGPIVVIAPEWDAGPAAHTGLPELLHQAGYRPVDDNAMDGGLPFYARFTKSGRRTIILTDLHDYYRSPMVDLAARFGPGERRIEARLISDDPSDAVADIATMRAAMSAFVSWLKEIGIDGLPRSQSAAAAALSRLPCYAVHRRERMSRTDDRDRLKMQRDFCQGGLLIDPVQPEPGEPVYCYDMSSAYPAVAATVPLPVAGEQWTSRACNAADLPAFLNDVAGWHFAICDLKVPAGDPLFSSRFGRRYLCGPELAWAAERGYVQRVNLIRTMATLGRPYRKLIADLYRRKSVSDGVDRYLAKILLNALLGRTAARGAAWGDMPSATRAEALMYTEFLADESDDRAPLLITMTEHLDTDARCNFGKWQYRLPTRREGYYSQPGYWAALVATQRVRLASAARDVQDAGGKVYYGDTDSLYVDGVGSDYIRQNLPMGPGLGCWDADPLGPDTDCEFRAARSYRWHGIDVRAGARLDGAKPVRRGYCDLLHSRGYQSDHIEVRYEIGQD